MKNGKYILISKEMPPRISEELEAFGYKCLMLPKFDFLDSPVSSHPDMLFGELFDGRLLCDSRYYVENRELLCKTGAEFVSSERKLSSKYPLDVAFDTLCFDGALYGNLKYVAPEMLIGRKRCVNVSQGYTKCSVLATDKCAITSDSGIYEALVSERVNALKISPQGIALPGYGCGFIGGASFFEPSSNTVVFFGNISTHPDFDIINVFLKENGHSIKYFEEYPLTDLGGAVLIKQRS